MEKKKKKREQECTTKDKEGTAATSSEMNSAMETHLQGRSVSWFTWNHLNSCHRQHYKTMLYCIILKNPIEIPFGNIYI